MNAPSTVGELEQGLFTAFPRADAESWDNPGLAVGSRIARIEKIAVALDLSVANVIAADNAGCNVLVTHHPAYIKDAPSEFGPADQARTEGPGRAIYEAAVRGVACIAMHTNADRSIAVRDTFAELMGCSCLGNFEYLIDPSREPKDTGLGAVLVPEWIAPPTLDRVAHVAAEAFRSRPRVWGDQERLIEKIAVLNGSWSGFEIYEACIADGIDCIITGETRYHMCVDAQPHLSIIELGHDRSELPIVSVLADTIAAIGVAQDAIVDLSCQHKTWWTAG